MNNKKLFKSKKTVEEKQFFRQRFLNKIFYYNVLVTFKNFQCFWFDLRKIIKATIQFQQKSFSY